MPIASRRNVALFLFLTCSVATLTARAESISFTAHDNIILNPERGLAKYIQVGPNTVADVAQLRADNHTIAWGLIRLDNFRNSATLPASKLAEVTTWLDAVRSNKVKAVLRVLYHETENFNPPSAPLSYQQTHLQQLGDAALKPYKDVILAFQAGGIGAYGEWYYAPPSLISQSSRKTLLDSMFDASADNAFVMVRTPFYKQEYAAAADDTGTYGCYPSSNNCPSVSALENAVALDSSVVPIGGETCNSTPRNNCAETLAGMQRFGYSFVNTLWYTTIREKWQTQGCFNTITKKLGYRFELVAAELPDSVTPGTDFQISVSVKNVGWAPIYKERPVYLRMTDANGNELLYYDTEADARTWLPDGQTYTFDASFTAPASVDTEYVSLSLWMPDNDESNYRTPEYAVQMANVDVWDPVVGDNLLAATVPVLSATACAQNFTVPTQQWVLLSLPCQPPEGATVGTLFADDVRIGDNPASYGSEWIVYTYDPALPNGGGYSNPGLKGSIAAGQGFWFVQLTGNSITLDLPAESTPVKADIPTSQGCKSANGCKDLPLSGVANGRAHWHLKGNPANGAIETAELGISTANGQCARASGGCDLDAAIQAEIVGDKLWAYPNGSYVRLDEQATIEPWYGFWLRELSGSNADTPVLHLPATGLSQ